MSIRIDWWPDKRDISISQLCFIIWIILIPLTMTNSVGGNFWDSLPVLVSFTNHLIYRLYSDCA